MVEQSLLAAAAAAENFVKVAVVIAAKEGRKESADKNHFTYDNYSTLLYITLHTLPTKGPQTIAHGTAELI